MPGLDPATTVGPTGLPPASADFGLAWRLEPFTTFMTKYQETMILLRLSIRGIGMLRGLPGLMEALAKEGSLPGVVDKEHSLFQAKIDAQLARQQTVIGFPLLYAQAVVTIWGLLERCARSLVVGWIENNEDALQVDAVKKLRVPLGEYLRLTEEERYEYVTSLLEQDLTARNKSGVEQFEAILAPFGLDGPVDQDVKRRILGLQQVRHVIVHRRGIVDRRLTERCPWLGLAPGDQLVVNSQQFTDLAHAAGWYVHAVLERVEATVGNPRAASSAPNASETS